MGKRILIVDDSPVVQTLSKKIFRGLGYEITGLKASHKALDIIRNNDIDIIILDVILPGDDGMTLAKKIRALEDGKKAKLPIIMISGNYHNYTQDDFDAVGISEYLLKPIDYDSLVSAVQKYS